MTLPPRSNRAEVRNPLLALPAVANLDALEPAARAALRRVLLDLRADALVRAQVSWRKSKAPLASYWKVTATYAGHTARLLREGAVAERVARRAAVSEPLSQVQPQVQA